MSRTDAPASLSIRLNAGPDANVALLAVADSSSLPQRARARVSQLVPNMQTCAKFPQARNARSGSHPDIRPSGAPPASTWAAARRSASRTRSRSAAASARRRSSSSCFVLDAPLGLQALCFGVLVCQRSSPRSAKPLAGLGSAAVCPNAGCLRLGQLSFRRGPNWVVGGEPSQARFLHPPHKGGGQVGTTTMLGEPEESLSL